MGGYYGMGRYREDYGGGSTKKVGCSHQQFRHIPRQLGRTHEQLSNVHRNSGLTCRGLHTGHPIRQVTRLGLWCTCRQLSDIRYR